ncbi:hypothetical protein [Oligoflexus tunisiensis]|uniref:hypothetical protein n=1 Tax=Oligoflexus tunisiensis TaxID=708132 RepID=UPI00114CC3B4|nr:hypothetical protein [Oligoflexus tunisiensis]
MSRQWPQHSLRLVLLSSFLTLSCSRPMTCALEGCNSDNGVVLADDLKPGESADAQAQQDDLKTKIKDIYNRLGATEALAALLREAVNLHESRLKTLENQASSVNVRLNDIDGMIEHHEEEIHAQAQALIDLEDAMNARIDEQAALQEAALDALRLDLEDADSRLLASLETLEEKTKEKIKNLRDRIQAERERRKDRDQAIAENAARKLKELKAELKVEIEALQDADADIRKDLCDEINRLDDRVDDVIDSTESKIRNLWRGYVFLQAQILVVAIGNAQEHARLRGEIEAVEAKLKEEVEKLSTKDAALLTEILALKQSQSATQGQLDTLQTRFEAFVAEQAATHAAIDTHFTKITGDINNLKTTLEGQIDDEAERIDTIMNVLLPNLSEYVTGLQDRADEMDISLSSMKDSLKDQRDDFEALKTKHGKLRKDFDNYASTTNTKISQLSNMLSNIKTCKLDKWGGLAVLTCGNTTVVFPGF